MEMASVTALTAAILAVFYMFLTLRVGLYRAKVGVSLGDGEDGTLLRRMRAHGNFMEYAPLFLILLGLLESMSTGTPVLLAFAGLFILARLFHFIGMHVENLVNPIRAIGAFGNLIAVLGVAITILLKSAGII